MLFSTTLIQTTLFLAALTQAAPIMKTRRQDSSSNRKIVVAHHMIGNTFPYTPQDWTDDIAQASAAGIDGFALNIGRDDWQPARVKDAYDAAKQSNNGFKVFLSLDMTSLPCASSADAQSLRSLVLSHITDEAQLMVQSHPMVSTFAGETCTFGKGSPAEGWSSEFTAHPDLSGKIHFVPSFFVEPVKFGPNGDFGKVIDGDFNWNSAWPIELTTQFAASLLNDPSNPVSKLKNAIASSNVGQIVSGNLGALSAAVKKFIGSTDTDMAHINGLNGGSTTQRRDSVSKTYMASVSPYFFTHYGADSFNKNFIFLSDHHLYATRWEALIADRTNVDIVQILTWNDYGESHYVGPVKGGQPFSEKEDNGNGGEGWVEGLDHQAWLTLTKYYATAFKTSPPTGDATFPAIEKDQIVAWARPHTASAQATEDSVGPPTNFELVEDSMWVVVMTTAPATVVLSTAANPPTNGVPVASQSQSASGTAPESSSSPGLSSISSGSQISTSSASSSESLSSIGTSSTSTLATASPSSSTPIITTASTSALTSSSSSTPSAESSFTSASPTAEPTKILGLFGADIFPRDDSNDNEGTSNTQTFQVPAGLTKLSIPLTVGGSMYARIERDGGIVAQIDGAAAKFVFQDKPKKYNFNALVLGSD